MKNHAKDIERVPLASKVATVVHAYNNHHIGDGLSLFVSEKGYGDYYEFQI